MLRISRNGRLRSTVMWWALRSTERIGASAEAQEIEVCCRGDTGVVELVGGEDSYWVRVLRLEEVR